MPKKSLTESQIFVSKKSSVVSGNHISPTKGEHIQFHIEE